MQSFFALAALATATAAMYIRPMDVRDYSGSIDSIVALLTESNHFGASNAPHVVGATPGWYFGDHPESANGAPWLKDPVGPFYLRGRASVDRTLPFLFYFDRPSVRPLRPTPTPSNDRASEP